MLSFHWFQLDDATGGKDGTPAYAVTVSTVALMIYVLYIFNRVLR